jgi:c-di-GMP-binding flagellar brake protein YcgR
MQPSSERRRSPRIAFMSELECQTPDGESFVAMVTDISTGGAHIDSTGAYLDQTVRLGPGSQLRVSFRIGALKISVRAVVRHSLSSVGMGVEFLDLSAEQESAIADLVRERLSHDTGPHHKGEHSQSKGARRAE